MVMRCLVVLVAAVLAFPAFSQDAEKKDHKVLGAKQCKICHSTDKKAGTHFKAWMESQHAKAFQTLLSDKAKEAAKKHGIEDPSKDEKCLACHTTKGSPTPDEGVSCEACHGAAEAYKAPHEKEGYEAALKLGMADLKGKKPEEIAKTCVECHKQDPMNDFYKEFKFEEAWAKIDHSKNTSPAVKEKNQKK
jgi:hypothetical protein